MKVINLTTDNINHRREGKWILIGLRWDMFLTIVLLTDGFTKAILFAKT